MVSVDVNKTWSVWTPTEHSQCGHQEKMASVVDTDRTWSVWIPIERGQCSVWTVWIPVERGQWSVWTEHVPNERSVEGWNCQAAGWRC